MRYKSLNYHTSYSYSINGKGDKAMASNSRNKAACFSEFYTVGRSRLIEHGKDIGSVDLSIKVFDTTFALSEYGDNYCFLKKEDIIFYINEINRVFKTSLTLNIDSEDRDKDFFYVKYREEDPTEFKIKLIPCLVRYLYEKSYALILGTAINMFKNEAIEDFTFFNYLQLAHIIPHGAGHVAFGIPSNKSMLASDKDLLDQFNRKGDYAGLVASTSGGSLIDKKIPGKLIPNDTVEIEKFISDHEYFISFATLEGFFE